MKPIFTKKNGTSQRVAAIEVKMPASYPSANVTYGSGSVKDALDDLNTSKYETISGTTDQYGVLVTNFTTSNFIIVSAVSAGNIVTPFVNASYAWRLRVTDFNGNSKPNTAVTIYAYYIKP